MLLIKEIILFMSMAHNANLKIHEWLAIVTISILIISIIALSTYNARQFVASPVTSQEKNTIEILVKGAVEYPGVYQVPSKILMKDVLKIVKPKSYANLQRYNIDKPILKGRTINIPEKAFAVITLEGAVKSKREMQVPKSTRLIDLINMVEFEENADTSVLKRKRKVKSGETIVIPKIKK